MLARVVLEKMLDLKQGREVGAYLKDPTLLTDARLSREVRRTVEADVVYGPNVDETKRLSGLEYEHVLTQRLRDLGVPYLDEEELRRRGDAKTPDALLPVPLLVRGRAVHWIDSKATFGSAAAHDEYAKQFTGYLNRYDTGLVIYWFGYVESVATQDPRIMVLDQLPREDVHLMTHMPAAPPHAAEAKVEGFALPT